MDGLKEINDKDLRKHVKEAGNQGFQLNPRGRSKHPKLRCPHGHSIPISCTPSDRRARKNILAAMKRCGYVPAR